MRKFFNTLSLGLSVYGIYLLMRASLSLATMLFLLVVVYFLIIKPYLLTWGALEAEFDHEWSHDCPEPFLIIHHGISIHKSQQVVWAWLKFLLLNKNPYSSPFLSWIKKYKAQGEKIHFTKPFSLGIASLQFYLVSVSTNETRLILRYAAPRSDSLGCFGDVVLWQLGFVLIFSWVSRRFLTRVKLLAESSVSFQDPDEQPLAV